jgi:hypothetical protein
MKVFEEKPWGELTPREQEIEKLWLIERRKIRKRFKQEKMTVPKKPK